MDNNGGVEWSTCIPYTLATEEGKLSILSLKISSMFPLLFVSALSYYLHFFLSIFTPFLFPLSAPTLET
jgi:hypothetical protein